VIVRLNEIHIATKCIQLFPGRFSTCVVNCPLRFGCEAVYWRAAVKRGVLLMKQAVNLVYILRVADQNFSVRQPWLLDATNSRIV
jgi:hypothetical protein